MDILNTIIETVSADLNNQLEKQILNRLSDLGYEFKSKEDLNKFAKERFNRNY